MAAKMLVLLIGLYRRLISPFLPARCRFYPTCSCYAQQAIGRFGLIKGGWLAIKRLLRCNPWHPGGVDPVPSPALMNTHETCGT